MTPTWYARPEARLWRTDPGTAAPTEFHRSLPGYAVTPLIPAPAVARELGVRRVLVKQEAGRFGLPAFKALGASWAAAKVLADRHGLPVSLAAIRATSDASALVTATDGNHGRALAHFAARYRRRARIVVPGFLPERTRAAIAAEGAEVIAVDGSYDDAVRWAARSAAEHGDLLVQDTAWPGYEEVPALIVAGYQTMLREISDQLDALGDGPADLVAVPVGVGSLAQAVVAYWRSRPDGQSPAVLSCEPDSAACVLASLASGQPATVSTATTPMAGLNCGTVSSLAWPVLRDGLDAAIAVSDGQALAAVADLADQGVDAGASGAAALAGARAAVTGAGAAGRRAALGVDPDATVVLLVTEGSAAA